MANHPAPPGHVLERIAEVRVLEVEECAEVAVAIDDDVDRGKVAMDEDHVEPSLAQERIRRCPGRHRQASRVAADRSPPYCCRPSLRIGRSRAAAAAPCHGRRHRSRPSARVEPGGSDGPLDMVGDQPRRPIDLDDPRMRHRDPRPGYDGHVRCHASGVRPCPRGEPTRDQVAAVDKAHSPRSVGVAPRHSRRLVERRPEAAGDGLELPIDGQGEPSFGRRRRMVLIPHTMRQSSRT